MPEEAAVPEPLAALVAAGLARAGERLSLLLGRRVELTRPAVRIVPLAAAARSFGPPETEAVAVQLSFAGDLSGQVLLLLDRPRAEQLVGLCLGARESPDDALAQSVLSEVGNIAGASFLDAVADRFGLRTHVTPPQVVADMAGAILGSVLPLVEASSGQVFLVRTDFRVGGTEARQRIRGTLVAAPDAPSLRRLLDMLAAVSGADA